MNPQGDGAALPANLAAAAQAVTTVHETLTALELSPERLAQITHGAVEAQRLQQLVTALQTEVERLKKVVLFTAFGFGQNFKVRTDVRPTSTYRNNNCH